MEIGILERLICWIKARRLPGNHLRRASVGFLAPLVATRSRQSGPQVLFPVDNSVRRRAEELVRVLDAALVMPVVGFSISVGLLDCGCYYRSSHPVNVWCEVLIQFSALWGE